MVSRKQIQWKFGGVILICCYLAAPAVAQCDPEWCGSQLNVSYPFWINNPSCGYPGFQIKCMEKENGNSSLFLRAMVNGTEEKFEILNINYTGSLIINSTDLKAISCNGTDGASVNFKLPADGPFTISSSNKFVVVGCKANGSFTVDETDDRAGGNCKAACLKQFDPKYCNNHACCETGIPGNKSSINFTTSGERDLSECGFSTIIDPPTWSLPENQSGIIAAGHYGLRLEWDIGNASCSMVKGTPNYSCFHLAECIEAKAGYGHTCKCPPGYEGTGYSNGTRCTDVDECSQRDLNQCVNKSEGGICRNSPGSYTCSCAKGYSGDGFQNGTRCQSHSSNNSLRSAVIGSVSSFIGVSFAAGGLLWCLRRRELKYAGDKNFIENGGIELQERIASMGGRQGLRMFSEKELQIASNYYSTELGRGAFATVYKGILLDGIPVAIKKPKAFSPEFINEIVILSHINHRNIVKLIGCCLRTQLPLLVYEFVPNGTLFEHLRSPEQHLSWEMRRQIAIEAAEGIAYVHREASQPIFHRDIKSLNILLDNTFTPKVADFGISRLRSSEELHLSTIYPSGTPGYVDPEFVRSNQFTEKSDVYSFGVVLVELLTGLQPILSPPDLSQQGGIYTLCNHFLSAINDGRLTEILDPKIANEENQEQMENMANLAKACLHMEGSARPSMREVVEELVWIRADTKQPKISNRGVTLPVQRGASTHATLNHYSKQAPEEINSWDNQSSLFQITFDDPSTSFIQMPDMRGR